MGLEDFFEDNYPDKDAEHPSKGIPSYQEQYERMQAENDQLRQRLEQVEQILQRVMDAGPVVYCMMRELGDLEEWRVSEFELMTAGSIEINKSTSEEGVDTLILTRVESKDRPF